MAYQYKSRVRFSETGPDHRLTLDSLVDYFQDCSTFQSEDLGIGMDVMEQRDRNWIVVFWQIDILRLPRLSEYVSVSTWPYEFKGFCGYRNYVLQDEQEKYLVKAYSLWVLMDMKKGRPRKADREDVRGFKLEPKLPMEYVPRKIKVPKDSVSLESFSVTRQHMDSNGHVNNGQYIAMAEEFLPDGFETGRLCVEYRNQAHLHDRIVPLVGREENKVTVSLCNTEGEPYAILCHERA